MSKFSASAPDAFQKTMFVQIAGHGKVWPLFQISRVEVVANSNIMLVRLSGTDFEGNFTEENFRGGQCYINFDLSTAGTIQVPSGYFYVKSITATAGIAPYDLEIWLPEPSQISHSVTITLDNDKEAACFFRMEEFFRACTTRPEWVTGLISREMYIENIVDFTDTVGQRIEYRGGISSVDGLTITHTYGGGAKGSSASMPQPVGVGTELFFDSFVRWDRLFWRQNFEAVRDSNEKIQAYINRDPVKSEGTVEAPIRTAPQVFYDISSSVSLNNWDTLILDEEVFTILSKTGNPDITTGPDTWTSIEIPGAPPTGGSPVEILYGVTSDSIRKFRGLLKTPIYNHGALSVIFGHSVRQGNNAGSGETYGGYHTPLGKRTEIFVCETGPEPYNGAFDPTYTGYVDQGGTETSTNVYSISISSDLLRLFKKEEERAPTSFILLRQEGTKFSELYDQDELSPTYCQLKATGVDPNFHDFADSRLAEVGNVFRWVKFGDDVAVPVRLYDPNSTVGTYVFGTEPKYNRQNPESFASIEPAYIGLINQNGRTSQEENFNLSKDSTFCCQYVIIGDQKTSSSTMGILSGEEVKVEREVRGEKEKITLDTDLLHSRTKDDDLDIKFAVDTSRLFKKHGTPTPCNVFELYDEVATSSSVGNLFLADGINIYNLDLSQVWGVNRAYRGSGAGIPANRVYCSPVEALLQILTSTGSGTIDSPGQNRSTYLLPNGNTVRYSFDVLPRQFGFSIPLDRIDIDSFLDIAFKLKAAALNGKPSAFLVNEVISLDEDITKWITEKILEPFFLGLTTDSTGRIRLIDMVDKISNPVKTILASDLEFNTQPKVTRDIDNLSTVVVYKGKQSAYPAWRIGSRTPGKPLSVLPTTNSYTYTHYVSSSGENSLNLDIDNTFGQRASVARRDIYRSVQKKPLTFDLPNMGMSFTSNTSAVPRSANILNTRAARFISLYNSPINRLSLSLNSNFQYEVGNIYQIALDGIPGQSGRAFTNVRSLLVDVKRNLKNGTQDCEFFVFYDVFPPISTVWSAYASLLSVPSNTQIVIGALSDPAGEWLPKSGISQAELEVWLDQKLFATGDRVLLYDENFVLRSTDGAVLVDSYDPISGVITLNTAWTASSTTVTPNPGDIIGLANITGQSAHALNWAYMDRKTIDDGPDFWSE